MPEKVDVEVREAKILTSLVEQGRIEAAQTGLNTFSDSQIKVPADGNISTRDEQVRAESLKIAGLIKQDYDGAALKKSGFPTLDIGEEDGAVQIYLGTKATEPVSGLGKFVDRLPLPDILKAQVYGSKEQLAAAKTEQERYAKEVAIDLQDTGLHFNDGQYFVYDTAWRLVDGLKQNPELLPAINAYLPRNQKLTLQTTGSNSWLAACPWDNARLSFGKQTVNMHEEAEDIGCHPVDMDAQLEEYKQNTRQQK
jgi:hypothetical protein